MMSQFVKKYIRQYRHNIIIRKIKISNQGNVLDLSCADGKFLNRLYRLKPNLNFFGIDISKDAIENGKRDLPFINFNVGNAEKLDFENETLDYIFSIMSLHHYEESQKVFEESERVLRINGILYLVDIIPKFNLTQKILNYYGCSEPYHFEKYYSISDLETILKLLGLSIVSNKTISLIPRIRILELKKVRLS